ncbi:hypothetical protein PRZ48_005399 [Zasmidium cellare]|uniref:RNB domain-containing protein n=1 Tax=Zasmidium cellare TaxID=395010 RepID=A0ABR0ETI5_ZASCE|nr:hypothetical protein PRZ48_005399 [Zasmidium cellare]
MLASQHGTARNATKQTYVCLSCRLKTQQKRRYGDRGRDAAQELETKDETKKAKDKKARRENSGRYGIIESDGRPGPVITKFRSKHKGYARIHNDDGDCVITKIPSQHKGLLIRAHEISASVPVARPWLTGRIPIHRQDTGSSEFAGSRESQAESSVSTPTLEFDLADDIDKHLSAVDRLDAARAEFMPSSEHQAATVESRDGHSGRGANPNPEQQTLIKKTHGRPLAPNGNPTLEVSRKFFSSQSSLPIRNSSPLRKIDLSQLPHNGLQADLLHIRSFHLAARQRQEATTASAQNQAPPDAPLGFMNRAIPTSENPNGIRAQLRQWQELHGNDDPMPDIPQNNDVVAGDEPMNNLTRLPDENAIQMQSQQEDAESNELGSWTNTDKEGYDGSAEDHKFLSMGDLVELDFPKSERESVLAVYVRGVRGHGSIGQFFTMQGRWMHLAERTVQYSVPEWASPETIKPLLAHLPEPDEALDLKGLMEKAYMEDLSVPRDVAAPLVKRMVDFFNESQAIYRRHASALDNAHDILSHDTDLRYGSLTSAATTLLQIPANELPLTALFTVRKALTNAGFAFNVDRRSHRLTGYMQIRSKEQVRMVDNVRNWVRQWQDDLAATSAMNERQLQRHKPSKGAKVMYGFLEKARAIVEKNRLNRQPCRQNNVGPSKVRLPITRDSDSVKVHMEERFTDDETEIVRFMESWSCSHLFDNLPRIESLPPLILHALGLYSDLRIATGFMFLQELGTIMPYENRIRFDPHLLLPSSQHSKPLQNLMASLISMRNTHNFVDSMAGLRHDWKDLPVFCIDSEDAHEIDDGVSVEPAGVGHDGRPLHWVHIHVANPTAFFSRDHPLAKMARHMCESIYMPERTYMMLPRWATSKYFSLDADRPCMTFSAKLDDDGNTLEHTIRPGIIRNVISLSPDRVDQLLGATSSEQWPELTLTVGGTPPPAPAPQSAKHKKTSGFDIEDLKTLRRLGEKRAGIRSRAGGLFFDSAKPDISVWQSYGRSGLSWDHPYRKGIRTVEGDPVIQFKTRGLVNWFEPSSHPGRSLVQELMLLAGEIGAAWCAERQIPAIYRGTFKDVRKPDAKRFWDEKIKPHVKDGKTMPLHLGIEYIQLQGYTALSTTPIPHNILGMGAYAKFTSPLRRYGDMIHHWQIEAALRHEAETGRSLIAEPGSKPNRSFLPFSRPVLETIMLGLQPREKIITRAKMTAEIFWTTMLMFRKCVFGDDGHLPFLPDTHFTPDTAQPLSIVGPPKASAGTAANDLRPLRLYVHSGDDSVNASMSIYGMLMELNIGATMTRPEASGLSDRVRQGDVWEVFINDIDVYKRAVFVKPVRLVGREGAGLL